MKKKKLGFTLVELLAVIVILAVILVIAVPRITEVIENSKKATFESSAKTIASTAEKRKMENDILENTNPISCSDVVSLNSEDYSSCTITFDGDIAKVSMIGRGKFENLLINEATKDDATAEASYVADYVKILYNDENSRTKNGLKKDNTKDENIRYYGENPNNYVKFSDSDEVWRIIGLFDGYIKLIKSKSIGGSHYSDTTSSNGKSINQWGESIDTSNNSVYTGATLQIYLNGMYYNTLSELTKLAIDKHLWNTAGVSMKNRFDIVEIYNEERSNQSCKNYSGEDTCNDTIERTTEWQGYIALPYPTDWAYASATEDCKTKIERSCSVDNWLYSGSYYSWFLSPYINSYETFYVWSDGRVETTYTRNNIMVYPSMYLKLNVVIIDGSGSGESPYILDIE